MAQKLRISIPNGLYFNNGIVVLKSNRIYLSKFHLMIKISTLKNVIYFIINSRYS